MDLQQGFELIVMGFPPATTKQALIDEFQKYGRITHSSKDLTRFSVTFGTKEEAQMARAHINGSSFQGSNLNVEFVKSLTAPVPDATEQPPPSHRRPNPGSRSRSPSHSPVRGGAGAKLAPAPGSLSLSPSTTSTSSSSPSSSPQTSSCKPIRHHITGSLKRRTHEERRDDSACVEQEKADRTQPPHFFPLSRRTVSPVLVRKLEAEFTPDKRKRPLSASITHFPELIQRNCIYVDKTAKIFKLVHSSQRCFLNRPRGFGKTSLISILRTYFSGDRKSFTGLAMEKMEEEDAALMNRAAWVQYPILEFCFCGPAIDTVPGFHASIAQSLKKFEDKYIKTSPAASKRFKAEQSAAVEGVTESVSESIRLSSRLCTDVTTVCRGYEEHPETRVVVLIDDYDTPLLSADAAVRTDVARAYQAFLLTLESLHAELRFVFVAGVSRVAIPSVFNALYSLANIGIQPEYSDLCGFTAEEVVHYYAQHIVDLAGALRMGHAECLQALLDTHGGYLFRAGGVPVCNPSTLLHTLHMGWFNPYKWSATVPPTLVVDYLTRNRINFFQLFAHRIHQSYNGLVCGGSSPTPTLLLYQTGCLTIESAVGNDVTLCIPNLEVADSLQKCLIRSLSAPSEQHLRVLADSLSSGCVSDVINWLRSQLDRMPSPSEARLVEYSFHLKIFFIFRLIGLKSQISMHKHQTRNTLFIHTNAIDYVFDFKKTEQREAPPPTRKDSAHRAIRRIKRLRIEGQYGRQDKKLIIVGICFSAATCNIVDYEWERYSTATDGKRTWVRILPNGTEMVDDEAVPDEEEDENDADDVEWMVYESSRDA